MKAIKTDLSGVVVIEVDVHKDSRGCFIEIYKKRHFKELGLVSPFVQDSISYSNNNVVRGLHFQEPFAQGKLVSVIHGTIFDVVVDIRPNSPNFKKWIGINLSPELGRMLWIPPGFAHGFATLTDTACILYKLTQYWHPEAEQVISFNDPELAIKWPIASPVISERDRKAPNLADIEVLPSYLNEGNYK
jgi:dTDP-4-dehydrorhamnose 3,5-epimerase